MTVQTLEKGFLVNVYSGKSSPGLLVSVLEAFEDLGLNVLQARVSCADKFHFEAVGGEVRKNQYYYFFYFYFCLYIYIYIDKFKILFSDYRTMKTKKASVLKK